MYTFIFGVGSHHILTEQIKLPQGSENKVVSENLPNPSVLCSSFYRGGDRCGDSGPLSLQPLPSALIGWPVCPPAETGRGAAGSTASSHRDPAATQLRCTLSRVATTFLLIVVQQAFERERWLVAFPPLFSQLLVIVVLFVAVQPPFVPELDRNGGRGGAAADSQCDGAAATQWAEELLYAPAW